MVTVITRNYLFIGVSVILSGPSLHGSDHYSAIMRLASVVSTHDISSVSMTVTAFSWDVLWLDSPDIFAFSLSFI